jgi:hypothetical protein
MRMQWQMYIHLQNEFKLTERFETWRMQGAKAIQSESYVKKISRGQWTRRP